MRRMKKLKEKEGKDRENEQIGIFEYKRMMEEDIMIYREKEVKVGEEKKKNMEMKRDIEKKLKKEY